MESRFKDRSLKIIGVDSSGAVRQLLNEVMKSLGFENFQAMASVQDALQSMEVESVDWLILPLMADQEVNAIHILRLLSLYPELKNIRITFFLEEEERYCLPDAFGLGLLSWLSKPYNKDSLTKELESFLSNFENENWDSTRLAASYCYDYLMQEKLHESALELINGFLDLYPADPTALIKLSRPLYELNRKSEANAALTQALLVDESLESEVQALRSELFGASDDDIEEEVEEPRNLLGIENCIIIDSDEQASAQIKELLTELGVKEILQFSDGESAWIWLQENESPAVIFHEWRIPKLTGPYFIQRVRGKFPCIPLIAVSALIREEDMPLIIEMGISTVVSKPVVKTDFIKAVVHVIRQERMPTDVEFLERKIRQNIIANNSDEISSLMKKYMSMAEIPVRRKMKMEAELAYYEEDYEKSRNLAVEALKGGSDSVQVLNLLGKSLMQMQDYEAALKCFEKAQVMSPKNIHRLCVIAEVSSELDMKDDSEDAIEAAKEGDAGNGEIAQTEAKIAISDGDLEKAKELLAQMESLSQLIAYMNNKAVTLARCGKYEDGIALYKKTINSIPQKHEALRAVVGYNLALAYVRMGEQGEAVEALDEVIEFGGSKVLNKSKSLRHRLEKALETGLRVQLIDKNEEKLKENKLGEELGTANEEGGKNDLSASSSHENKVASGTVKINPGDMCCFRVFDNPANIDARVEKLLHKSPKFNYREAIRRAETGGADMVNAAS